MNQTSMDKFITILQNLHKNILDFKIKFQKSIYTIIVNKQQYTLETSLSMQCWNIDDKQVLKRYPQHWSLLSWGQDRVVFTYDIIS